MSVQHVSAPEEGDSVGLLNEEHKRAESHLASHNSTALRSWLIPILCLILGFVTGALFHSDAVSRTMGTHTQFSEEKPMNSGSFDLGDEFTWSEKFTLWPEPEFKKEEANETDVMWESLMPLGRGFVEIDSDGKPVIYSGALANLSQTKVVAAFHQMHCLNLIRRSLAVSISDPHVFYYLIGQLTRHWDHCFDYLRQVLMCMADTTLEELERDEMGEMVARVDGWGTERVCRSWVGVRGWAGAHRGTDDGGID